MPTGADTSLIPIKSTRHCLLQIQVLVIYFCVKAHQGGILDVLLNC